MKNDPVKHNARKRKMSVKEAGKRGGTKTKNNYGKTFYHEIGLIGGNRVKELIEEGKKYEKFKYGMDFKNK